MPLILCAHSVYGHVDKLKKAEFPNHTLEGKLTGRSSIVVSPPSAESAEAQQDKDLVASLSSSTEPLSKLVFHLPKNVNS